MSDERTVEPAQNAELSSERDNPLVALLTGSPLDGAVIIEELKRLSPDEQSAHWVDQLLDDPRCGAFPSVRQEAVRTLLKFGHPWALLINPEDLAAYRKIPADDIRPRWLAFGSAVGAFSAMGVPLFAADYGLSSGLGDALAVLSTVWGLSVAIRALLPRAITRIRLIREVMLGLGLCVIAVEVGPKAGAIAMLAAVTMVAFNGLSGGWKESNEP